MPSQQPPQVGTATTEPSASGAPLPLLPPLARERPRATPLDPVSARAAGEWLSPIAAPHVAAAKPVPAPTLAGQFLEGQALDVVFTPEPGRCYTIVAAGLPAVEEVDLELSAVLPPGVPSPVLAADSAVGATAVIGSAPNCWRPATPIALPAKLSLVVAKGRGVAALRVYAR